MRSRLAAATFALAALVAAFGSTGTTQAQSPGMYETYVEAYEAYQLAERVWIRKYEVDVDDSYGYARLYTYYGFYSAYYGYVYDAPNYFIDCFWLEYYAALEYYDEAFTGRRVVWPDKQVRQAYEKAYLAAQLSYSVILDRLGR
ncbi:MAG TPA: hypothetical protein VGN57_05365 [Pirellulaceae bacterium]|nr:hypothetical protein [Pirellulaceae bacterium]